MQTDVANIPFADFYNKISLTKAPTFQKDINFQEIVCDHDYEIITKQKRCGDEAETIYRICKLCKKIKK